MNKHLLAVDIGNTQTVIGVFDKKKQLKEHWRLETKKERTADEIGIFLKELLLFSKIALTDISAIILSNVVPPAERPFDDMAKRFFNLQALSVHHGLKMNIRIGLPHPEELGADRIVNAVAAYEAHREALIVVDFGTATTFDFISADGEYRGGIICPGPQIAADALFHAAAKLPRVDLKEPKRVLGQTTIQSIQSGLFYGYVSLVDGLVSRLRDEQDKNARVVATGGLSSLIAPASQTIQATDEFLTLNGLALLYEWNK